MTGAITGYIDVAQLVLYAFWIFFFVLVLYLHRESKREGYPLVTDSYRNVRVEGFPGMPDPKEYKMPHGAANVMAPRVDPAEYEVAAKPIAGFWGAALHPTGDAMVDGVGPAAWAIRPQFPDLTEDGRPKIVPLRVETTFAVNERDPDPRGKAVYGVDGEKGAEVVDIWVDRSEPQIRYYELDANGRRIMLPATLARVGGDGSIKVKSVTAAHFANAPTLASTDQITLQEEDQVCAYFAGGYLYALPERTEPII